MTGHVNDPRAQPEGSRLRARWLDEAKGIPLAAIINELGIAWERAGKRLVACPSCGAEKPAQSHRSAGAVVLVDRGTRWWCSVCNERGDGPDLVSLVVFGRPFRPGEPELSRKLRGWFGARGWCSTEGPVERVTLRPAPPPERRRAGVTEAQLGELWGRCGPVTADEPVSAWLRSRALDPVAIEDRGLARALPEQPPGWASFWRTLGGRCILPVFGQAGELVSLQARTVLGTGPKSLAPKGCDRSAGVLADGTGRALLRGEAWLLESGCRAVFLEEGDVDWLTRASMSGEADSASPVLGVLGADALPDWLPAKIPSGWAVLMDEHRDEAGARLLERVRRALSHRCHVSALGGAA